MTIDDRRTGQAQRPSTDPAQACACGQALDCCHRAHCPRCGEHLRQAA